MAYIAVDREHDSDNTLTCNWWTATVSNTSQPVIMLLYAIMWMMVVVDATLMMLVVLVINIQPLGSLAIRS